MIDLDLGASARIAFIWTSNPGVLSSGKPNLGCDLSCFNFVELELLFSESHLYLIICLRMNKLEFCKKNVRQT